MSAMPPKAPEAARKLAWRVNWLGMTVLTKRLPTEAASLFAEDQHRAPVPVLWSTHGRPETVRMWWLYFQLALMPLARHMALTRGRSTRAWLETTLVFGPLAILALPILGKRNSEAMRTMP